MELDELGCVLKIPVVVIVVPIVVVVIACCERTSLQTRTNSHCSSRQVLLLLDDEEDEEDEEEEDDEEEEEEDEDEEDDEEDELEELSNTLQTGEIFLNLAWFHIYDLILLLNGKTCYCLKMKTRTKMMMKTMSMIPIHWKLEN